MDGELIELADMADTTGLSGGVDGLELARYEMHDISVVVDRLVLREGVERRLTDSVETGAAPGRRNRRDRDRSQTRRGPDRPRRRR